MRIYTLFTIWSITVDNHMANRYIYIYILISWSTTVLYKRYLLMLWCLVYPVHLVHFQISRLMPEKCDGHSADVILKWILFIENVVYWFICQWKLYLRISHHWFTYRKRYLQMAWYLVYQMVEVCSEYIGSGNGLVSNSKQAITWTNIDHLAEDLLGIAPLSLSEISIMESEPLNWYN